MRKQSDFLEPRYREAVSRQAAIVFDPKEDQTRQDLEPSTNINRILRQLGGGQFPTMRQPQYAEVDFDVDLQTAYGAMSELRAAVSRLPAAVLKEAGGVEGMIRKLASGEIERIILEDGELPGQDPVAGAAGGSSPDATRGGSAPPKAE